MADKSDDHVIKAARQEEKSVLSDLIHKGIQASDEEIAQLQPQWSIPDKAVILADLGHHLTASEVIEEANASLDAGACSIHLHIKDEEGNETSERDAWERVLAEIKAEHPNVVIDSGLRGDSYEEQMYYIREEVFDVVPISASKKPEYYRPVLEEMQSYDVKPRLTVFCPSDIIRAKAEYIETGLIETPAIWAPMIGNPYHGVYLPNPMATARILMYMLESIQDIDPGAFNLVTASNRASNFLAVQTAVFGHHLRLGMGETRWRFPHKDIKLTSNETAVSDATQALETLGREPATALEYREMIGLD